MSPPQILVLALFLVPVWSNKMFRCYNETELLGAAERKLRSHYPQPAEPSAAAARGAELPCPLQLYQQPASTELSARSVSPWTYVLKTLKDHFPSSYMEASCLCSGCILVQKDGSAFQSFDYNSLTVKQSRVFLRRQRCSDGSGYYLTPVTVEVAVGCTCVRANSSP
ncbi:interleukin-17C-like isoform X1 [Stegastes partitus]|nr:PREDICTED: interleukin-17C-like isoform X1 [Stegastes partitus]